MKNLRGYWGGGSSSAHIKAGSGKITWAGGMCPLAVSASFQIDNVLVPEVYNAAYGTSYNFYVALADSITDVNGSVEFVGQMASGVQAGGPKGQTTILFNYRGFSTPIYFTRFSFSHSQNYGDTYSRTGAGIDGAIEVCQENNYFTTWDEIPLSLIYISRSNNNQLTRFFNFTAQMRITPYFSTIAPGKTEADGNIYFVIPQRASTAVSTLTLPDGDGTGSFLINAQNVNASWVHTAVGSVSDGYSYFLYTPVEIEDPGEPFTIKNINNYWCNTLTCPPPSSYISPLNSINLYMSAAGGSSTRKFNGRYIA